jgi:uncharacterized protein (TIGR03382 family)
MVTRRISLTLAALAGIGLAIAQGAGAQVIVQTFTVPNGTVVPWNSGLGFNFTFNLFDSTKGVLDEVNIALSTNITAEVDVFNSSAVNQAFTNATANIPVTLTAPDAIVLNADGIAGPVSGTASPGFNAFSGLPATASSSTNVAMADWIPFYEGVGTNTGNLNALASTGTYSGTANPSVFFGGSAVAGATITITYVYQPAGSIPEPGATTFLAAGVLGSLGMVVRRRRRK